MFGDRITVEELEEMIIVMQEDIANLEEAVLALQHEQNSPPTK